MKLFFSIFIMLLIINTYPTYSQIEAPDDFEPINAVLTGNIELENKLAIFEKYGNLWIGAYKSGSGELTFFEINDQLVFKELSKLKFNDDENIIFYNIKDDKILIIFGENNKTIYAKSVVYDYRNNSVINSELVYALMPPKTIQEGDLNEDLDYKVKDNYELISLKDWNKLYIKISESGFIGLNVNSFDNSILLYNFVKTGSDDLYIYYSIIGYDGRLIKSEFKLLSEKAFDIYNDVKGFFGILQTGNIPTFFVDFASDKDRKINSYTLNSNEIITATTEYPLEIRGSNEHFIKSSKQIGSDPKIICLINEDKDKFSDTYGILSLEISKDFKSIDRKLKVWSKDEVNKLSNGDKLECNSISDILIKNGDIFLIIESNELEMVYEQSTYIPVSHLREALILRLNTALDTKWSHYIKDRDFKRIISCDNKCKYLVEPEKRFNLKFTDTNHNDKFSIYYGDNESEQFTRKVLDLNEGKVLSDDKLFEIDKLFFFYPQRMYFDENQIIMYLSVDCDSHIVKFKLPN